MLPKDGTQPSGLPGPLEMSLSPQEVSSFLPESAASQAAQQGAVAPAGMSLRGGRSFRGGSETQPLKLLLRHVPLQFTGQEAKLP